MGKQSTASTVITRYRLRLDTEQTTLPYGVPGRIDEAAKNAAWIHARLRGEPVEVFGTILYDEEGLPIGYTEPFRGIEFKTVISLRYLLGLALQVGAAGLVVYHNHPQGPPNPSQSDVELTGMLMALCQALGLVLQDHLVVNGEGAYASMRAEGLLHPKHHNLLLWLRWWEDRVQGRKGLPLRCGDGRTQVKPQYRDPATGRTWSGRGSHPKWLRAYLEAGASKEDFRIGHERARHTVVPGPWGQK